MRSQFRSSIKIEQRQKCHIKVCEHYVNVIYESAVIISDFTGDGTQACWTLLRNCLEGHIIFSSPLKYPWRNVRHSPQGLDAPARPALFLVHYLVVGFVFITLVNDKHSVDSSCKFIGPVSKFSRPETLLLLIKITKYSWELLPHRSYTLFLFLYKPSRRRDCENVH